MRCMPYCWRYRPEGFRRVLKTPASIMHPDANPCNFWTTRLQNVKCAVFGKYTFANVTGAPPYVPFENTNRPSGSINCSDSLKVPSLLTKIDTPFDLE